ncbi:MAG: GNAT family N-acetyltransferase [Clostridia bacterium]
MRSWRPPVAALQANRAHIRRWFGWPSADYDLENALQFIALQREQWAREGLQGIGIWRGDNLLGGVTPNSIDRDHHSVALGYWIAASDQGQDLVTQACQLLVDDLFRARGMHRVFINVHPDNHRSQRVPEWLGLRQEGTLRQYDRHDDGYSDWVVYAVLADDWMGHS